MRKLRREMQIIFQDPFASLNPRMNVRDIVGEPIWLHGLARGSGEAGSRFGPPAHRRAHPRVMAIAIRMSFRADNANASASHGRLAGEPKLIIGDEPVSALDVSIQAQIINLLEHLKDRFGLTLVIIAHDLAVIRHMSDRVAVMYLGEIVELSDTNDLFDNPAASLHAGASDRDPGSEPGQSATEAAAAGRCAEPGSAAERMPVSYPLPSCDVRSAAKNTRRSKPRRRTPGSVPLLARDPECGVGRSDRAACKSGADEAAGALQNVARAAGQARDAGT